MAERIGIKSTEVARSVEAIGSQLSGPFPATALILGSGLGRFGEHMSQDAVIEYGDIPGFPVSTVVGHHGRLLIGTCGTTPLVCMQGRLHLYEGYRAQDLAIPIRTLRQLGVDTLIITNAAGGLRPDLVAGTLMIIDDHINMSGYNPLIGPNDDDVGERFFDMSAAYDAGLRARLRQAAKDAGVDITSGVYVQTPGPNFETPAEVKMFAKLGADAVGMSTVPECLVAIHCGMKVAGLSLITNLAAGIAQHALSHEETLSEADKAYERISQVLLKFFEQTP